MTSLRNLTKLCTGRITRFSRWLSNNKKQRGTRYKPRVAVAVARADDDDDWEESTVQDTYAVENATTTPPPPPPPPPPNPTPRK